MDFNFADLKKEAAATSEDIFNKATQKAGQAYEDLVGGDREGGDAGNVSSGAQDDNAHTEHYFANEQKNLDFGDPQAFVQRMSAGAKEAQEQLDAKFAQKTEEFDDFIKDAGHSAKQGISDLTSDFMNAERGFFGGAPAAPASAPTAAATPVASATEIAPKTAAPQAFVHEEDLLGSFGEKPAAPLQPFEPTAPAKTSFYDDDDFLGRPAAPLTTATASATVGNQDSDTESPSVSYTPSPAKKPIVDALKEQDNEKFISSEDLLSDFREERTVTPPVVVPPPVPPHAVTPAPAAAPAPVPVPASGSAAALVTDLDDEEDFKPSVTVAPKAEPKPEPPKNVVPTPKVETPKPRPAPAVPTPASKSQPQPKIVSVEEIFYKYGLDAWFKPERLHPQVESLIYWRDVKKSGIVFGAGLITLVAISSFSVISVFAYLSLLALFGTIAFRIYKSVTQAVQKTSDGHPFKEYLELDLTLSQEKVQNIAGVAVAHINGFTAELRRLFLVEDLIDSIKFGVILWVFTYIGAWFNGMTLVILAFVSLFTLPKVYENNKQSIDTYLDLVRSKLTEITDKIRVAIPIGNKKPVAAAETDKDK
ncbi:reticulon-1 isoform X1 [Drosophila guanche]|uniref:Reticulon-like protein n=1 Tax=Drosophila guanche TaxID=7266 RepID=A0A3B0JHP3_DROGU|nr:reticulon-1 isoform X1 [Drosophila guanche]SPP81934.1 blast:Reticulon-1 [Drosophila guanche]